MILALFFVFLFFSSTATPLKKFLNPREAFCFNEDLPKHSLVQLSADSGGANLKIEINYLREIVYNATSRDLIQKSFTTQNFGIYRICFTNIDSIRFSLKFDFNCGVRARDFGSTAENEDIIKAIENQARIAQMFIDQIEEENKEGLAIINQKQLAYKGYSMEYFFSVLFVGLTMGLTYAQFQVIRNHLHNKKYL